MLNLIIRFTKRIIKLPRAVARDGTVTTSTADQLPSSPPHLFLQQTMSLTWSIFAKIDMVDNKHSHRCLNYNLSTEDTNEHKQHRKYQAHDQF